MRFMLEAACGCHRGKKRNNNEDNFYFDGKCLERGNNGLKNPAWSVQPVRQGMCYALFDGMGGENFGEMASFAAARKMQQIDRAAEDYFVPERKYLREMVWQLNDEVEQLKKNLKTSHMGTTMVSLYFSGRYVYVCNVGDSRAYRLRQGELLQISKDHVEHRPGREYSKGVLSQHLGIDREEMEIDPYIAKGELQEGDIYLLCSDGLTDMLSNFEIFCLLRDYKNMDECATALIRAALEKGGLDNITVLLCKVGT